MTASIFNPLLTRQEMCGLQYEFWPAVDARSRKTLVVLHGRGDSPEGFHFLPGRLGIDVFNVLFLRAPDEYFTGFSWYDLPPKQAAGIVRSRDMIMCILDKLQSDIGLRATDIFLFGFSQGCLMCIDVALRYPHHLGGVVGVSGYVFFEEEYPAAFSRVAREQKLWISHGRQDEMLAFDKSQASVERLREQGISIDWNPVDKGHTIDEIDELPASECFYNVCSTQIN